jgi:integrase
MLKKPPRVRDNNGALQVRLRLDGRDFFINRLGRFDDPVAQARAQAICAEIWRDAQQGDLDLSLNRYRPLVEGRDQDLLDALRRLSEEKRQARVTHTYRVVQRFGMPIRTRAEVDRFLAWMKAEGLAASTQSTILCTIRSVQPGNEPLRSVQVKVPARSVQEEVLSREEIKSVLDDLRSNEEWFYPCFALWLGTGLRNAEVIGLTWDCVRLDEGELLISKTLRRDGTATLQRVWSGTKTGKARVVPLGQQVVEVLKQHRESMQCLGLNTKDGLVFVTPRTHRHLYDAGLEKVWKRSQRRVGLAPRRLYAQRHSFLSHALAMGNSPADLAAVAGHRTEELLRTYAKPTGRVKVPTW